MKKYILILTIFFIIFNLGNYLDITENPKKSDLIIVLGGDGDARIIKGLELYVNGYSKSNKIIITGTDVPNSVDSWKYSKVNFLLENNISRNNIVHITSENISNTMEELIEIKKYLLVNKIKDVIIISHPSHSKRIKILANYIANYKDSGINISFVSAYNTKKWNKKGSYKTIIWNKRYYFLNLNSIELVIYETMKIFYNLIKYISI